MKQIVASDIQECCSKYDIKIHGLWKPRDENKKADHLSRITDRDDWEVSDNVYQYYDILRGIHSVDRFATHYNNKCARFNSKYWCPGTEGVDAFNQNWSNENNWMVPPPALIARVINKILREKASSTLVVPEWRSSPYWPLVFEGEHFKTFISHWSYLPLGLSRILVLFHAFGLPHHMVPLGLSRILVLFYAFGLPHHNVPLGLSRILVRITA